MHRWPSWWRPRPAEPPAEAAWAALTWLRVSASIGTSGSHSRDGGPSSEQTCDHIVISYSHFWRSVHKAHRITESHAADQNSEAFFIQSWSQLILNKNKGVCVSVCVNVCVCVHLCDQLWNMIMWVYYDRLSRSFMTIVYYDRLLHNIITMVLR